MILARVEGTAVSVHQHPSLKRQRVLICQPINREGEARGGLWLALDPLGAALYTRVVVSTDGSAVRDYVGHQQSPLRNIIIGLVDPDPEEATA